MKANYNLSDLQLSPYARYSSLDLDSTSDKNTLWKTGIEANMGIFGAYLAYGETNKEGGNVGIDASSDTGMDDHWRVTLSTVNDASAIYASVNAQVTDKINLALKYSNLDARSQSTSKDQNEVYGQVSYKLSNNLNTYLRLGKYENDKNTTNMGRAHIQYTF
uniref:porin n=1 Tax=Aliarcobacter sp. TaxID=2321116 RepID=UPI00404788A7